MADFKIGNTVKTSGEALIPNSIGTITGIDNDEHENSDNAEQESNSGRFIVDFGDKLGTCTVHADDMARCTKDDLLEKIEAEYLDYLQNPENTQRFITEAMTAMRDVLYNIPMTDEMIQALFARDNALGDAVSFFFNYTYGDDHYYEAAADYLNNIEFEYIADKLHARIKDEYDRYIDGVKKLAPDEIVDEAYRITILNDFICALDPDSSINFSTEQLKALMSIENPILPALFQEWLCSNYNTHMDDITELINEAADEEIKEGEKHNAQVGNYDIEDEAEDGQEP